MSRRKNVSTTIPNGTIIQTRDEHFHQTNATNSPYSDPNHPNPNDYYRTTVVVDSNRDDELALVKKTTHGGRSPRGTYSDYVEVLDSSNNPIKIGQHFRIKRGRMLSKSEVSKLRKRVFKDAPQARKNRYFVHRYIKKRRT